MRELQVGGSGKQASVQPPSLSRVSAPPLLAPVLLNAYAPVKAALLHRRPHDLAVAGADVDEDADGRRRGGGGIGSRRRLAGRRHAFSAAAHEFVCPEDGVKG